MDDAEGVLKSPLVPNLKRDETGEEPKALRFAGIQLKNPDGFWKRTGFLS